MQPLVFVFALLLALSSYAFTECPELIVEPGKVVRWRAFRRNAPAFSLAIDGYVEGPTRRDVRRIVGSLNHHEGVDRLSTSSTGEQALLELRMGLFDAYQLRGQRKMLVWANDCDEDVCTTMYLLRNPDRVLAGDEALERFVVSNDRMDRTAGTYPLVGSDLLAAREWVFQPYREAKTSGALSRKDSKEYRHIIDAVGVRIDDFLAGRMPAVTVANDYRELEGGLLSSGSRWVMVEEQGSGARLRLVREGVRAFVFVFPNQRYSIGRTSDWVPFPLEKLYEALNAAEPPGLVTEWNRWSGSDLIGGSPRSTNSKLSPSAVARIVRQVLTETSR